MCGMRKCGNSNCSIMMQSCQLIQGLCTKCYQESIKPKPNVPNQSQNNNQPVKQ